MNPADYILHIPSGNLHAVRHDDPIRKRKDMRLPTQAEVDAWFGVQAPKIAEPVAEPVALEAPVAVEVEAPKEPEPLRKPRRGRAKKVDLSENFLAPGEEL